MSMKKASTKREVGRPVKVPFQVSLKVNGGILKSKGKTLDITFPPKLLMLAVLFVRMLRDHKDVQKKPSVRASIGIYERAQANAFLAKRRSVTSEDVADAIISVIGHRLELKPSAKYLRSAEDFVGEQFKQFIRDHPDFDNHGGGSL